MSRERETKTICIVILEKILKDKEKDERRTWAEENIAATINKRGGKRDRDDSGTAQSKLVWLNELRK